MKPFRAGRILLRTVLLVFSLLAALNARGQIELTLEINQAYDPDDIVRYYSYPYLELSDAPITAHTLRSPNGLIRVGIDSNLTWIDLAGGAFPSLGFVLNEITNGVWTLVLNTNHPSQQTYTFPVTITNLNPGTFPVLTVHSPVNGATGESSHPVYHWAPGPTNWSQLVVESRRTDFSFSAVSSLNLDSTNWPDAPSLPAGEMQFALTYTLTNPPIQIATPTNGSGPLGDWVSASRIRTYRVVEFTVNGVSENGHALVAHYPFDGTPDGTNISGFDASGNGYDINGSSSWGGPDHEFSSDAAAGAGAVLFHGFTALAPPEEVVQALAGSFTISAWIKTTQSVGNDDDPAWAGVGVVHADVGVNGSIPIALTGSKAAFRTGNAGGPDDTLHSTSSVNDGSYTHIVVTRSQATGEKKIYINGILEGTSTGTTAALDGPREQFDLLLGGRIGLGLDGLLDDVQIYSGVLSASEVEELFNDPGATIPDVSGPGSGAVAHYRFDEDAPEEDSSGNGYDMDTAGGFGGGTSFNTTDAIAGSGSTEFDTAGGTGLAFIGWNPTPGALLDALAGSFSVSLWVKTTDAVGFSGGFAFNGAGIVSADVDGPGNDVIPVALTDGEVAFNTGGDFDETLNSFALVNDGEWHHIVVTRDQSTGEKSIYIDGALDNSGFGTTNLLNDPQLLTIGAIADASDPDPLNTFYYNGYEGLLDDLQIYSRPLNSTEVAFLYNNPGFPVTNGTPEDIGPVGVEVRFEFNRVQAGGSEQFYIFPFLEFITPGPITEHRLRSPNGFFEGTTSTTSATIFNSLDAVLNECTNGAWTITINEGHPTETAYTFTVSVSDLTTNLLSPVNVTPAHGALNVPPNTTFQWSGPTNFSSVLVFESPSIQFATLPGTATNWVPPAPLPVGSNTFQVSFTSNNFPNVSFTLPIDGASQPVSNWTARASLKTMATTQFVVSNAAQPVQLLDLQLVSGNALFTFATQSNRLHAIEARTNLVEGAWIELTNFSGDGTLKQFSFPTTNPPTRFFRVKTQ